MELDIPGFPLIGFVLKYSEYANCYDFFRGWVTGAGKFRFSAAVLTSGNISVRLFIFKNYGDFCINRSTSRMTSYLISSFYSL